LRNKDSVVLIAVRGMSLHEVEEVLSSRAFDGPRSWTPEPGRCMCSNKAEESLGSCLYGEVRNRVTWKDQAELRMIDSDGGMYGGCCSGCCQGTGWQKIGVFGKKQVGGVAIAQVGTLAIEQVGACRIGVLSSFLQRRSILSGHLVGRIQSVTGNLVNLIEEYDRLSSVSKKLDHDSSAYAYSSGRGLLGSILFEGREGLLR
jgi:hypothetical protein